MSWIQRLSATRNETNLQKAIIPKLAGASSCKAPLCAACQFAMQHRKKPGTSIEIRPSENLQLLKSNHLQPGDMISVDQYLSTVPGRLEHTKGKEVKKYKYVCGKIFADHAGSFIYVHKQVTLRAGDTLHSKFNLKALQVHVGSALKVSGLTISLLLLK